MKEDTEAIKADTAVIRGDVSQIPLIKEDTETLVQEIAALRFQVTVLTQSDSIVMQRFLDDTNSYAETVLGENNSENEDERSDSGVPSSELHQPMRDLKEESRGPQVIPYRQAPAVSEGTVNTELLRDSQVRSSKKRGSTTDVQPTVGSPKIEVGHSEMASEVQAYLPKPDLASADTPNQATENGNAITDASQLYKTTARAYAVEPYVVERPKPPQPGSILRDNTIHDSKISQNGFLLFPKKRPDYAAIEASKSARSNLSTSERKNLDKRLELLISNRDRVSPKGQFGTFVDRLPDIKATLDAGAYAYRRKTRAGIYFRSERHYPWIMLELQGRRRPEVIAFLLSRGALLDIWEHEIYPIMKMAIITDKADILQHLLDYGLDPQSGRRSALYLAIESGSTNSIKALIGHGVDVNYGGDMGGSPLMYACYLRAAHNARTLLENGARVLTEDEISIGVKVWGPWGPLPTPSIGFFFSERRYSIRTNEEFRKRKEVLEVLKAYGTNIENYKPSDGDDNTEKIWLS